MILYLKSTWKRLIGYFLTGVFTILPLAITVAIVAWVAGMIRSSVGRDTYVGNRLNDLGVSMGSTETLAYWMGWILVLAAIFILGVLVEAGARQFLHSIFNGIVGRIPLCGSVYHTARQLVGMLEKRDDQELSGMSVVYCFFGKENSSAILALRPTAERFNLAGRDYNIVYIPTSPLPMTGGLIFVPCESVHSVDMPVDGLMSIYLSMGVTTPTFVPPPTGPIPKADTDLDTP